MEKLEFGFKCKDIISGFEGILKSRAVYITGCDRVELVDEKNESKWFDVPTLKVMDVGVSAELESTNLCNKYDAIKEAVYDFGTVARDKITEFTGTVVAKSIGVSGDISYCLSPKFDKTSKENDGHWIDEGRVETLEIKKEHIVTNTNRVGGAVPNLKYR